VFTVALERPPLPGFGDARIESDRGGRPVGPLDPHVGARLVVASDAAHDRLRIAICHLGEPWSARGSRVIFGGVTIAPSLASEVG
jgi:hypothetical protein